MHQLSLRERLGAGVATAVILTLGIGYYLRTQTASASSSDIAGRPALAPVDASSNTTNPLEIPARGTPEISSSSSLSGSAAPAVVVVHVAGAVKNPGVYKLKPGDRIIDAVHASGGFKANAQQDALNLADMLQDADQIYIPVQQSKEAPTPQPARIVQGTSSSTRAQAGETSAKRGRVLGKKAVPVLPVDTPEALPPSLPFPPTQYSYRSDSGSVSENLPPEASHKAPHASESTGSKFRNPGDGLVHLNTATESELEKLPGVGQAMASRIIEYRNQIGSFSSVEQLQDVKGIGAKTFTKLRPFVTE